MNAKNANSGAVPYISIYVCVRACVCQNIETKYLVAWLLTNKKRNNVERTDENDQRVLLLPLLVLLPPAKQNLSPPRNERRAVSHCIEELSARGCIKNINILLFVSGIQNNAYENTYIYIQFCVCVRGRQSVVLPVCMCVCSTFLSFHIFRSKGANQMIHFKYSLSCRRQL